MGPVAVLFGEFSEVFSVATFKITGTAFNAAEKDTSNSDKQNVKNKCNASMVCERLWQRSSLFSW